MLEHQTFKHTGPLSQCTQYASDNNERPRPMAEWEIRLLNLLWCYCFWFGTAINHREHFMVIIYLINSEWSTHTQISLCAF